MLCTLIVYIVNIKVWFNLGSWQDRSEKYLNQDQNGNYGLWSYFRSILLSEPSKFNLIHLKGLFMLTNVLLELCLYYLKCLIDNLIGNNQSAGLNFTKFSFIETDKPQGRGWRATERERILMFGKVLVSESEQGLAAVTRQTWGTHKTQELG